MRKSYQKIDDKMKYLEFSVSGKSPRLRLSRVGDSRCSLEIDALDVNECSSKFHIKEPSFGVPDGWYDLEIFVDGCCHPCLTEKVLIDNRCQASLTNVESVVFPECES